MSNSVTSLCNDEEINGLSRFLESNVQNGFDSSNRSYDPRGRLNLAILEKLSAHDTLAQIGTQVKFYESSVSFFALR